MPRIPLPPKSVSNNMLMSELGLGKAIAEPVSPERNLRDAIDINGNISGDSKMVYSLDDFYNLVSSDNYPDLYDEVLGKMEDTIFNKLTNEIDRAGPKMDDLMSSLNSGKMDQATVDPKDIKFLRAFRDEASMDPQNLDVQQAYKSLIHKVMMQSSGSTKSPATGYASLLSSIHDLKNNAWSSDGAKALFASTLGQAEHLLGEATGNKSDFLQKLVNDTMTSARPGGIDSRSRADYPMRGMQDSPQQYQNSIPNSPPQDVNNMMETHVNKAVDEMSRDPTIDTRPALESESAGRLKAIEDMMMMIGGKRRPIGLS